MMESTEISLLSLPVDVIRVIFSLGDEPFAMRTISPSWNALALEHLQTRFLKIDGMSLTFVNQKDLSIALRLPKGFLGYFGRNQWKISGVDRLNDNLINLNSVRFPFDIVLSESDQNNSYFLGNFLSKFFNWGRNSEEKRRIQNNETLTQLERVFKSCSHIKFILIFGIRRAHLEAISDVLGSVKIDRLVATVKDDVNDEEFRQITSAVENIATRYRLIV